MGTAFELHKTLMTEQQANRDLQCSSMNGKTVLVLKC